MFNEQIYAFLFYLYVDIYIVIRHLLYVKNLQLTRELEEVHDTYENSERYTIYTPF